jgi:hypothetical protein
MACFALLCFSVTALSDPSTLFFSFIFLVFGGLKNTPNQVYSFHQGNYDIISYNRIVSSRLSIANNQIILFRHHLTPSHPTLSYHLFFSIHCIVSNHTVLSHQIQNYTRSHSILSSIKSVSFHVISYHIVSHHII